MIRIAVISGKGGTGKTMVTCALADTNTRKQVLADCDVDAANLELLLSPTHLTTEPFSGLDVARIDPDLCIGCGICVNTCAFGAITMHDERAEVHPLHCEGCGLCCYICPEGAAMMEKRVCGEIYTSSTEFGPLVHARLFPGSGTSGLLVHEVKKRALTIDPSAEVLLVDGPPGIGCPLISTISGMNAVLIVTEPSVSALHDCKRLVTVCRRFDLSILLLINRFDLLEEITSEIEAYAEEEGIATVGKIPFDSAVVTAVRQGTPITRTDSPASKVISTVWDQIRFKLDMP
ncbi:4Fe-4S dicluster domain-containing protein [Methanocalculus taiwanensis]|uniref:4Fe-4S dicluster domain-containing protein n=1 Tax=Methanocalculus taiwanensis TaxID=106207 RepID=A0ABD4TKE4_9EURY|nr:ATP-binding protein [Methanocalculus taiwanensis]MCQ1538659.1 4Fe-4S dicluster domain-containing protein [Methanocalculus taiwanensis]